jgi:proteasome lid subunit RPN8/RPN11
MSTRLNYFILPDSVLQKMKKNIEESRIKDIEIGFNLCTENGNLHDENPCTGAQCSVDIPKGCNKGRYVGLFHTHPHSSSEPSIQDIANAYQIGINCIGSTEEKNIKCYVRKDASPTRENLETIVSALIRYESPLHLSEIPEEDIKNYRKWIKVRNDLKRHYLHTVEIV